MSLDEFWLFAAFFLLVEVALLLVFAPVLCDYAEHGELGTGLALLSVAALVAAFFLERVTAALIVVAVLQP